MKPKLLYFIFLTFFGFQNFSDFMKIHKEAIVIDLHNDTVQRMLNKEDISVRTKTGHIDIPRLREGGIDAAVFSVWIPPGNKSKPYFAQAKKQIDLLLNFAKKHSQQIVTAYNSEDILRISKAGKIALMLSMEGAHPVGDDLKHLDYFYERGVRSIMLTWNNSTNWATSASDETQSPAKLKHKGLTGLGKKFVKRMDELGIIIDVSHAGETTFWDVIKTSTNPIIASHSAVASICPNHRNLSDDQIKAIAASGGIIGVNFAPWFLDSEFVEKEKVIKEQNKARIDSVRSVWKGDALSREAAIARLMQKEYDKILPTLNDLVNHIEYVIKLAGVDYVGLGSDFDGISVAPKGVDDVTLYPNITKELIKRGYSKKDLGKILGGNFLRVLSEVEKRKTPN